MSVVPRVFIPLRGLVHIKSIVNEQFLPSLEILQSLNSGNFSIAGVKGMDPFTVGLEAVIDFVGQCCAVIFSALELKTFNTLSIYLIGHQQK